MRGEKLRKAPVPPLPPLPPYRPKTKRKMPGNVATRNGCEMEMNDVRGIWKQLPHGVSQAQGCKSAALSTALTFWGEIVARKGGRTRGWESWKEKLGESALREII